MRRRSRVWVLCGALLAGLIQAAAAPHAMAAGTAPAMTNFAGPTQPVDLEQVDGAWFTMHLTDDAGIAWEPQPDADSFDVTSYLAFREPGSGGRYIAYGTLVSGTTTDGDWKFGPFGIAKPYGHWEASEVHLVSVDGDMKDYSISWVFDVIGRFGAFASTTPGSGTQTVLPYGARMTISGTLRWYYQGGHPLPGVTLTFWEKDAHTPTFPDGDEVRLGTTTTRSDGTFSFTFTPLRNAFRIYLTAPQGTTSDNVRYRDSIAWTGQVLVRVVVGLGALPRSAPQGTTQLVQGAVVPLHTGQSIYLQRATSRGWQTVSSARIRASGRYTLTALPPSVGRFTYRVYKPSDADHFGAVSRSFVLLAT